MTPTAKKVDPKEQSVLPPNALRSVVHPILWFDQVVLISIHCDQPTYQAVYAAAPEGPRRGGGGKPHVNRNEKNWRT